jgi:hypothetical protein
MAFCGPTPSQDERRWRLRVNFWAYFLPLAEISTFPILRGAVELLHLAPCRLSWFVLHLCSINGRLGAGHWKQGTCYRLQSTP